LWSEISCFSINKACIYTLTVRCTSCTSPYEALDEAGVSSTNNLPRKLTGIMIALVFPNTGVLALLKTITATKSSHKNT
jgi:hypothetical protein